MICAFTEGDGANGDILHESAFNFRANLNIRLWENILHRSSLCFHR